MYGMGYRTVYVNICWQLQSQLHNVTGMQDEVSWIRQ